MVGSQPLNRPGTKGNIESPIGSTRYATPRHGQWLGWLVRVEARRVSPKVYTQMDWLKGMVPGGKYTGGRRVCVQGMKARGLCAGDEGQGAVCRG